MVAIRHRGRPQERSLDVPEDSLQAWADLGYEAVDGKASETKKAPAKKAAAKKSSK